MRAVATALLAVVVAVVPVAAVVVVAVLVAVLAVRVFNYGLLGAAPAGGRHSGGCSLIISRFTVCSLAKWHVVG